MAVPLKFALMLLVVSALAPKLSASTAATSISILFHAFPDHGAHLSSVAERISERWRTATPSKLEYSIGCPSCITYSPLQAFPNICIRLLGLRSTNAFGKIPMVTLTLPHLLCALRRERRLLAVGFSLEYFTRVWSSRNKFIHVALHHFVVK